MIKSKKSNPTPPKHQTQNLNPDMPQTQIGIQHQDTTYTTNPDQHTSQTGVGKIVFASHTKPIAEATQVSTSFL